LLSRQRPLLWENYRDGELYVSRSIWNGRVSDPKTRKGRAPVPVIRQLADRLEMHRLRSGGTTTGPIFANGVGKPLSLGSVVNRIILPALSPGEVKVVNWLLDHALVDDRFADYASPPQRSLGSATPSLDCCFY